MAVVISEGNHRAAPLLTLRVGASEEASIFSAENELWRQNLEETKALFSLSLSLSLLEHVLVYDYIPLSALLLHPQRELQPQVLADTRHTTFDL